MSIKLKDTIYDLIDKSIKDSLGNIITNTYLKKTGDVLNTKGEQYDGNYGINLNNSDIIGVNAITFSDFQEKAGEGIRFVRSDISGKYDAISARNGILYFSPNGTISTTSTTGTFSNDYIILHSGNYTDYAATKSHTHSEYSLTTHTHPYLPLSGGTMTGTIYMPTNIYRGAGGGITMNNSDIVGVNAIYTQDLADSGAEGYQFKRTNGNYDSIWAKDGTLYFSPNGLDSYSTNYTIYHSGNFTAGNAEYSSKVLRSHYGTSTDNDMNDRPTSANITWVDKTTRYFLATSSMTTGKPPTDAKILHLAWDNSGWGSQLGIGSGDDGYIYYRSQGAGNVSTTWTSWRTVLDSANYSSYCITRSGGTINNGALNMTNNRLRMVGTQATPTWNQSGAITWCEDTSDGQAVSIVYTSYDSYRSPAGLKVMGSQGGEWFEAPNIYCTTLYIGGSAITFTT